MHHNLAGSVEVVTVSGDNMTTSFDRQSRWICSQWSIHHKERAHRDSIFARLNATTQFRYKEQYDASKN